MTDSGDPEEPTIECRICHSKTPTDLIISPCLCKGSLAHVHFGCLERWLNHTSRDTCELCRHGFNVVLRRRYSCLRSLHVWLRRPVHRAFVFCDLCIATVLTVLTLALVFLSLISVSKFRAMDRQIEDERGSENIGQNGRSWAEGIVNVFLVVLLAGYFATMYSMVMDHVRPWHAWWIGCNDVTLVLDKNDVPESGDKSGEVTADKPDEVADCRDFNIDKINNDAGVIEVLGTRIETIV